MYRSITTCGTEAGSYLRLIDSCITQLKAQGSSRTCNESKEEAEVYHHLLGGHRVLLECTIVPRCTFRLKWYRDVLLKNSFTGQIRSWVQTASARCTGLSPPVFQVVNLVPGTWNPKPSSASLGLTDNSSVDMLGVRYTPVIFGVDKSLISSNW